MIVYSSTSASQKAYEKLYTLGGIDAKAHLKLDDIEGVNPIAVMSPLKADRKAFVKNEPIDDTCIFDCSEAEIENIENREKIDLAVSKLKELHTPIIVHFSPEVKEVPLDPSQQGITYSQGAVDSGICRMFSAIVHD